MSAPQSRISMCSGVRLNSRYEHTIYFPTAEAQEAYFAGKETYSFSAYTYLRKSWPLRVQATMQRAKTWNYCYFRNAEDSKIYYYFVSNVEYINDYTVELTLELDVLQTYLFDMELLPSFVERQHPETDDLGEHTIDEGLELGELVNNGYNHMSEFDDLCILVLASFNPNYAGTETPVPALAYMYNKVFSGLKVWAVESTDWQAWGNQLDALSTAGFIDGIVAMWMYPKRFVTLGGGNSWGDETMCKVVQGATTWPYTINTAPTLHALGGYEPRNKKLYTYPFAFVYASNNSGGSAVYRYERMAEFGKLELQANGAISADGGIRITPKNYNGAELNFEEGLTLGNFPACAWDADVYKLWLAQNQNQHAQAGTSATIMAIGGGITALAGMATANPAGVAGGAGMMYGAYQQTASLMAQKRDMSVQPPQARGSFSANVNITAGRQSFTLYYRSVDAEHAKAIDNYFTLYGYKINRVQVPNISARPHYTYIKTVGCHIRGKMCNEDIIKVESIFDQGITWWKDGDAIGNYTTLDNTPVED